MAPIEKILGARELALQGFSQRAIAEQMGISLGSVNNYLKLSADPESLDKIRDSDDDAIVGKVVESKEFVPSVPLSEDQKQQLSLELDRLDDYLRDLNRIRKSSTDAEIINKTIRTALAVHDRRAKYLGLDRPISFETESSITFKVEGVNTDKLT